MNIAGIDPGLSGALAIVAEQAVLFVDDLPTFGIPSGRRTRPELDLGSLRQMLCAHAIDHVVLERVAARPGQGTVSMFRFGYAAGAITGLVAGLQLPYSFLLPKIWQKKAGVGPSPEQARKRAAELFPPVAPQFGRKKDAGRADAILPAYAGLKMLRHTAETAA
jgi:crossover junction endodeoxyribonuclease RuvC